MLTALTVVAGESSPPDGLFNVSLTELGATAKGSGAPFNKDWPPNKALVPGRGGGGTLFGSPLVGGRVDISLLIPVDIVAIEVVPLDYHGTQQPKAIDIFVDGKLAKQADLPETPGKPIRIPLSSPRPEGGHPGYRRVSRPQPAERQDGTELRRLGSAARPVHHQPAGYDAAGGWLCSRAPGTPTSPRPPAPRSRARWR